jgi:hypothetical protein
VLLAACVVLVAAVAQAADPFYLRLLREGTDAYNRREFVLAVRQLRTACFGLLDEPELLASGLVRLGLAQAAVGDTAAFGETFQRVAEVEERFGGFGKAEIPRDVRDAFTALVERLIPRSTLLERPAIAKLMPGPEGRVANLPPAERRKELERLMKTEPASVQWPLALAELDLAQGDAKGARGAADAALKLAPTNKAALRLRGLALTAERRWQRASDDLAASGAVGGDSAATEAQLRCLVELARFDDAGALVAQLPKELAAEPSIQELSQLAAAGQTARQATPNATPPASGAPSTSAAATTASGADVKPTPAAPPPAGPTEVATPPPTPSAAPTVPPPNAKPTQAAVPEPDRTPAPPAATASATPATRVPAPAAGTSPAATVTLPAATLRQAAGLPTAAEQHELNEIKELVRSNKVEEALLRARKLADAREDLVEAQFLAAEIAYRTAQFREAAAYFRRGGDPGDARPLLLFYQAVSLYEVGELDKAVPVLQRALPNIRHTAYVEAYAQKILGPGAPTAHKP